MLRLEKSLKFNVAVLQMRCADRKKEKNTQTVIAKMNEAAKAGADILLLPECFITGYAFPIEKEDMLREDEACLESGDEFKVCDFHGIRLGIMICYDREYPESARVLMLKGAEIILVPNDCTSMKPRVQALSTRAYENMVGIAMANPNGRNAGSSCAYSPICWDQDGECVDNTIFLADDVTEGLFYAEFAMDKIRDYREHEMMGNTFRKINAYRELLCGEIHYPFIRRGQ